MTPNVNFGQIVRGVGPEHRVGTFTGVLDMRGMVKVANAILALKAANNPDWDAQKDARMKLWLKQYIGWLESSPIAKKTASSAKQVSLRRRVGLQLRLVLQQPCDFLLYPTRCGKADGG